MSPVYYGTEHCRNCESCSVLSVLSFLRAKSRSILSGQASLREVIFLNVFPSSQHNCHVLRYGEVVLLDNVTVISPFLLQLITRALPSQLVFLMASLMRSPTLRDVVLSETAVAPRLYAVANPANLKLLLTPTSGPAMFAREAPSLDCEQVGNLHNLEIV